MLYTAVKQALQAFVHSVVGRSKAVVTRPLLSAFRHGGVSDWYSVKNSEDQEGEGRRVRRVRFAMDVKKEDGVLHPYGVWLSSPTRREVGGEVRSISKPSDYEDGNLDDWCQHYQEDLGKRASYWHLVKKKSLVEQEYIALEQLLQKTQQVFWDLEDKINAYDPRADPWYYVRKKDAVEKEFYALRQQLQQKHDAFFELERKIDALDPEAGEAGGVEGMEEAGMEETELEEAGVEEVIEAEEETEEDAEKETGGVDETEEETEEEAEAEEETEEDAEEDAEKETGGVDETEEEAEAEEETEEETEEEAEEETGGVEETEEETEEEAEADEEAEEAIEEETGEVTEELGSGFATDAAGRVRRFSHRLKGKSRRIYKF
ncbi:predicted protein [Chaetoceros tenuissimus]|uniref:Uncharacterized protein n=1 Tax=Chaetoceros tenuissimus TaxID=426638 RepID=A0AAD3CIF8_9STRA|nr:predicted protein [Chaetoceros tenuissimus]